MVPNPNVRSVFDYWVLKVKDEPEAEELKLGYVDAVFTVNNSLFKNCPKAKKYFAGKELGIGS